jgi:hypothetical protein
MKRMILVSIGLVLLLGCGSKRTTGGSVKGTITYKGKPVNGALLRFYPQAAEKKGDFMVPVSQEGNFSGFEIPPGEYKVVVEAPNIPKMEPPKDADEKTKQKWMEAHSQDIPTIPYPDKYKKITSTDLKCTITQGKQQDLALELKD